MLPSRAVAADGFSFHDVPRLVRTRDRSEWVAPQDGVASLVRPFVVAGARAVVANLWAADDTFSAALMREFYRELAGGADIGESLRRAKLRMIESFGPEALPKLWSGVLVYGDASAKIVSNSAATRGGNDK